MGAVGERTVVQVQAGLGAGDGLRVEALFDENLVRWLVDAGAALGERIAIAVPGEDRVELAGVVAVVGGAHAGAAWQGQAA